MEQVDWQGIMETTLTGELGMPQKETDRHIFWAGTQSDRDESKSFRYEPATGLWYDWSAGKGGRGVYSFLAFIAGMDREAATGYLRGKGLLGDAKPMTWRERARMKPGAPRERPMEMFANAIHARGDDVFRGLLQSVFDCGQAQRADEIQEGKERAVMIAKEAWQYVADPVGDSMIELMKQRGNEGNEAGMMKVHNAYRKYAALREQIIDALAKAGVFPPVGEGSANLFTEEEQSEATNR